MNDFEIIEEIKNGNKEKFSHIYKKYKNKIFYYIYLIVNNPVDAEDLTMIAIEKSYERLDRYRPHANFSTWLYRIARNTAFDYIREKNIRPGNFVDINTVRLNSFYPNPEECVISDNQIKLINFTISKLKPVDQKIINLWIDDYQSDEIAEELNMNHSNVRGKLLRIRKKLKHLLS